MTLRSTLLFAALAACCSTLYAAPRIALSSFIQEDTYSNPRLSPDGKYIAITVRIPVRDRFVPMVTFYSLPDLKIVGQLQMLLSEVPLDYNWVSNTRLVIDKGLELGLRERPVATGEVIATEFDGSKQEYLYGYDMFKRSSRGDRYGSDERYGNVEDLPRVLNSHLFLTSHLWDGQHSLLYDVDTRTAIRKLRADVAERDMDFMMQPDGTPRFSYGLSEDRRALLYRYNDAKAEWEKLGDVGTHYVPKMFSPDGREFLASYAATGGLNTVIKENLATGARVTLYDDPNVAWGSFLQGPQRALPFGLLTETGIPHAVYFDQNDESAKLHKLLSQQFPGSVTNFIDFTADGNLLLFSVSSDRDPGSYYLFNRTSGKADLLFSATPAIEPDDMAERRPISFKARDGLRLHGYLTMPKHAPGVKPPFVLLPHGGPVTYFDRWYFDQDAQFLASRGYAVLQVNFRGSGGRGDSFEQAGYRQWGAKIQDDLVDGVRWAVAQGEVDGDRGCVYGASFGGYSALMLAARETAMFKCAVGYAGVYDLKLIFEDDNTRREKKSFNYWVSAIGQDKEELARFSPVALAEKITIPVMLVHGGKDKRAPIAHADAMRAALVKVNRPPEWVYAPNEGHGFYDTANLTMFYEKLEAFLEKYIGK
jgi:dipeptidyl aminopeptidase/acylaminoacyl peptidase